MLPYILIFRKIWMKFGKYLHPLLLCKRELRENRHNEKHTSAMDVN
jgi:hypothetical protein